MKLSFLCVCLFICLSGCTPAFANEKLDIETLSKEVKTCDYNDVEGISKEISSMINDTNTKISQLKIFSNISNLIFQKIEFDKRNVDKNYQYLKDNLKVSLSLCQQDNPYAFNDIYSRFVEDHNEIDRIEKLENTLLLKSRLDNKYQKILNDLDSTNHKINDYASLIMELQKCQELLFERFRSELSGFKASGDFNRHKTIQGITNLDAFGGYYKYESKALDSCLEAGNYSIDSYSLQWHQVVENGTISAGTWSYRDGSTHLGLDVASSMSTDVYAPANGVILYADAPVDSNNGYLSNWCGWPLGGGNTICMIVAVNEKLYGVTLAHLSNQILVYPGQQVSQGDLVALSGNSGNSSGPHTHIEVFEIKVSLEEVINYFIETADFSFGNGFDTPNTCSQYACRIRPETVF